MNDNKKKNLIICGVVLFVLFVIVIVAVFLYDILRPNPYGDEIVIDNFSEYFKNVSRDTRDFGFSNLYEIVYNNYTNKSDIKKSGALVRDGSANIEYDKKTGKPLNATFIVDVPFAKQSYKGFFDWGNTSDDYSGAGYRFVFSCLPENELIYGDFNCVDMFSSQESPVPICNKLPVMISDYDVASRTSSSYSISCYYINDDEAKLLINDFSGGNYEKALDKIRELGFDPVDYAIEYNDQGGSFSN